MPERPALSLPHRLPLSSGVTALTHL